MLVHPWDAAGDEQWRAWLGEHEFGQLVAPGRDRDLPIVVPTPFLFDGADTVELHLARPNPVWSALAERPRALLSVVGDDTYIPSAWNAVDPADTAYGIPTSYYAAVQLSCDVSIVDDPVAKADLLNRQLARYEQGSGRAAVSTDGPDGRQLPGIRGIVLTITSVRAKFKYGGNKSAEHRERIAARLAERDAPADHVTRRHLRT